MNGCAASPIRIIFSEGSIQDSACGTVVDRTRDIVGSLSSIARNLKTWDAVRWLENLLRIYHTVDP